jgi:RNA polymerase-associated protein
VTTTVSAPRSLHEQAPNARARARKDLKDSLLAIAPIFAEMPFFMSEEFTIVDCCLGPILWRLQLMEITLPKSRQAQPLLNYMARLFARDSFRESLTEFEREMYTL